MKLDIYGLDTHRFEKEIETFLSNTGRDHWKRAFQRLESSTGEFYSAFLITKNPLLEPLRQYFELQSKGKSIWKHITKEIGFLASTAFITNKTLQNLSDIGKKQILGRFRDENIRPLLSEMAILAHFLSTGFDVELVEYEMSSNVGRTFEFLVEKDNIQAEVECKFKSYDAGRKITHNGFAILCDEVIKQLGSYKIKCLVELICKQKLGKSHDTIFNIVKELKSGIYKKETRIIFDENFLLSIHYLEPELKINSKEELGRIIAPYQTETSHFAIISNKGLILILKIESEKKDKVLDSIYSSIEDSVEQFSKNRPALITCYVEGVYPEQWEQLRKNSGLALIADRLFRKKSTAHIHTLSFLSESETREEGNITENWYPTLLFRNPNCVFFKEKDVFAFGRKTPL